MKTVLITGAAGMVGQVLMGRLADTYELRGLDIRPAEGIDTVSIADFGGLLTSLRRVDVVVHLGAVVSTDAPWDDALEHNIVGTRNVYEAAKVQGVRFEQEKLTALYAEGDQVKGALLVNNSKELDVCRQLITTQTTVQDFTLLEDPEVGLERHIGP